MWVVAGEDIRAVYNDVLAFAMDACVEIGRTLQTEVSDEAAARAELSRMRHVLINRMRVYRRSVYEHSGKQRV